jgi:hypothetical protein
MAITLGLLESAAVGFGGAFIATFATTSDLKLAAIAGGGAFFGTLGYGGVAAHLAQPSTPSA